ncbi:MAG: MerR family transcriptional regulator [Bacillota bacterium]|nr:MerR family transcriptional regulator [Bacillota bacterium]
MELEKLSIGQMAKLNRVSEQTLRLYDREGLLNPMIKDEETGYRYYHIIQSARLDMIQYMKSYGMTLKQIKAYLSEGDVNKIKEVLEKQRASLDSQIRELTYRKQAVSRVLENYAQYEALPKNDRIFLQYIPRRRIYRYTTDKDFFDQDYTGYEYMLRELKIHLEAARLPMIYFCNVGTMIKQETLRTGKLSSHDVFFFVDTEDDAVEAESVDAAMYCCICSSDFYQEADNAQKLLQYIEENQLEICGDYLCEVLLEFPVIENEQRNWFYRLQIPVIEKSS